MRAYRLVPAAAAAWIAAGICIAGSAWALPMATGLWCAAAAALGAAVLARRPRARAALVVATLSCALAAASASHVAATADARREAAALPVLDGRTLQITATVTGKVEPRSGGALAFDAVVTGVAAGGASFELGADAIVVVRGADAERPPDGLDVGAVVSIAGTARPLTGADRAVLAVAATQAITVVREPHGLLAVASDLRRDLGVRAAGLPGPGAELIPGLAVGDTAAVSAQLDAAMKQSSLSHLTAVSGANCALVVGIAYVLLAGAGAPRAGRVAGGAAALGGFVLLVTPEPSVVRAAAMAAIAMLSLLLGRRAAGVSILSLAVAVLLVLDPWLAGSLGFALSAAATAALLVLARPLGRALERALPRALAWTLAVPLAAQLACGPLIVLIDPTVPVYGVAANLIAAPAAPAATVLGLLACLAAPVAVLADGLVALAWVPASWVASTAETFAALPGSGLPWIEGAAGAAALALAGAVLVTALVPLGVSSPARAVRAVAVALVACLSGAGAGAGVLASWGASLGVPAAWTVFVCDVGQGDAILVRSAGSVALVDTGEDAGPLDACLRRAGIGWIDVLVLTHFDVDHAGAAPGLAGRVGLVLHGPRAGPADELLGALTAGGAETAEAAAGMSGSLGEARWRVLWPVAGSKAFAAGNDASVVLDISGGGIPRILLLGDLSAAAQAALARGGELAGAYSVVKVAHHGSADQDPGLYERAAPLVALVSAGTGNPYGHPRAAAIELLRALGIRVHRTDRHGAIAVWEEAGRLRVWWERGEVDAPR
ncbi:ComEC/Rec2 family competence protein [Microbacterium thalassium]|uniref:Competence protein ComEC n=1 Tax=Microbacterium thalassium TaxID=362649 RepID=A0A7X0FR03_9MICO|nr:ComEC/Rec2 family competence protein [Microbacterium thalassium]MBB6392016.1 competence protein ComEC [Microbacterium thalassium]